MEYAIIADDGLLQLIDLVPTYQAATRRVECANMKARNFGEKVTFSVIDSRKNG